uniref:DeoR/GlpR family DNA-binding transcription regulator n=1 Tax=Ndongobacter massiliensis TaxID=1871025 RepID=UPI000930DAC9|nr:DeoR/GlpR family DNA-binding transcription regulator [Ndongobacter massiliensis]
MLKIERHEKIMEILHLRGSVLVTELSTKFSCSDETIRRDLKELEDNNELHRTHGGAFLTKKHDKSYPSEIRQVLLQAEKKTIVSKAVQLIHDNDFLFLDSSTTCLELCKSIIQANLSVTIVTNSLLLAQLCCSQKSDIDLVLLGGALRTHTLSTASAEALDQLMNYYADICFLSPPKISLEIGITDNRMNEARVRSLMMERSYKTVLLADHTKFQDYANLPISTLEKIDILITDATLANNWYAFAKKHSIQIEKVVNEKS